NVEPDAETTRLFREIREQARQPAKHKDEGNKRNLPPSSFLPHPASALPHPITTLIGREQVVRAIVQQVAASRLVTLVGGGGVGKPRVSAQVAREAADDLSSALGTGFADGAVFVALASLSDPALLPAFVAAALGLREEATPEPEFLLQALVGWLSTHDVLLLLDNCEHLIAAVAALAQTLLERCPRLRILATSRQRLGLTREHVWPVPSMPAHDPSENENRQSKIENPVALVMQYSAVQLFVERAAMARPGFRLAGREESRAVAQVCSRLDGIP